MYDEKAYEQERGAAPPAPGMPYKISTRYGWPKLPDGPESGRKAQEKKRKLIIAELERRMKEHEADTK